ncbi:MAG: SDR family NAD(P)-dependent oxidoreductase [Campylobacterales bacterium]|nr:SDR family NAD(P)-dependent oxidoreductase [Campylobacterales bacterium]
MHKIAVVTGASSGIGKEITKRLLSIGFYVIGVSRTVRDDSFIESTFEALRCDLSEKKEIEKAINNLKDREIFILINCAGFGKFEPHEELNPKIISDMITVNLTAPILLTNGVLRKLKQNGGYIININSIEALRASKFAGVYSATKAGLKAFGDSLFEETRKSELSVTNINPDMTESGFYNDLRFETSVKEDEKLFASDIADAVEYILSMRKGAVMSECTIRGLKFGITKKKV